MKAKSLLLLAALSIGAIACKKQDIPAEPDQPVNPEAPVIVSASLRGPAGETEVEAASPVVFKAEVSVKGSTLDRFILSIKNGEEILGQAEFQLSGTSTTVEREFDFAISPASVEADFYPEVTMKITNTDDLYTEETLSIDNNVKIKAPIILEQLYLIDNNSHLWTMKPAGAKGCYRTEGNLGTLGTSFKIASNINPDNSIDPSGKVWEFNTPDAGEYGLRWLGFDYFNEELSKMIDKTIVLDYTYMADDQGNKVFWNMELVQDCRVVFLNYPDGMLLQGDRFADVDKNSARYTGHTLSNFEIYYIPDTKWLIVKDQWNHNPALWVTGENASLPMQPYCLTHPFAWFAGGVKVSYDAASFIKTGENSWKVLMYLKSNFGIKIYDARAWANEITDWVSTTPETLRITPMEVIPETGDLDGNYGVAGTSFTEGLYMMTFDRNTKKTALNKYTRALPSPVAAGTNIPE